MVDDTKKEDAELYLLDDDTFARVIAHRYQASGKPRDTFSEQRIWNRLDQKSDPAVRGPRKRGWIAAGGLAAAALIMLLVRSPPDDPGQPIAKSGLAGETRIAFVDHQGDILTSIEASAASVRIESERTVSIVVYGMGEADRRVKLLGPIEIPGGLPQVITLPSLDGLQRVCGITADGAQDLARLEDQGRLDLIWSQLSSQQCLNRHEDLEQSPR